MKNKGTIYQMKKNKKASLGKIAVFLDRDGTINEDSGYIDHPNRIELIPRSRQAIKRLNKKNILTIIVSNQSGVGRGYLKRKDVALVDEKLKTELVKGKAYIDDTYYCYHHPDNNCSCRKPKPGMLNKAARKFHLDLTRCFVVGDHYSDIALGYEVGAKTVMVLTGHGRAEMKSKSIKSKCRPDYVAKDLYAAVNWILKQVKKGGKVND
jgi:D-glycero-D-manno-heptose 1,7-bisphosphate phosphatase